MATLPFLAWTVLLDLFYGSVFCVLAYWLHLTRWDDEDSRGSHIMQSNRLRWFALILTLVRLTFVTMCGLSNGEQYYEKEPSDMSTVHLIYHLVFALVEEGSSFGKLVLVVLLLYSMTDTLRLVSASGPSVDTAQVVRQHLEKEAEELGIDEVATLSSLSAAAANAEIKTLLTLRSAALFALFWDLSRRISWILMWLTNTAHKFKKNSLAGPVFLITYILFWTGFVVLLIAFYQLYLRAAVSFVRYRRLLDAWTLRRTAKSLQRLERLFPLFVCWFFTDFAYAVVNMVHFFHKRYALVDGIHKYTLVWFYWFLSDILFYATVTYHLEPPIEDYYCDIEDDFDGMALGTEEIQALVRDMAQKKGMVQAADGNALQAPLLTAADKDDSDDSLRHGATLSNELTVDTGDRSDFAPISFD